MLNPDPEQLRKEAETIADEMAIKFFGSARDAILLDSHKVQSDLQFIKVKKSL